MLTVLTFLSLNFLYSGVINVKKKKIEKRKEKKAVPQTLHSIVFNNFHVVYYNEDFARRFMSSQSMSCRGLVAINQKICLFYI